MEKKLRRRRPPHRDLRSPCKTQDRRPAARAPPPAPAPPPPPLHTAAAPKPAQDQCGAAPLQALPGGRKSEIPIPLRPRRG